LDVWAARLRAAAAGKAEDGMLLKPGRIHVLGKGTEYSRRVEAEIFDERGIRVE
jgi:hypothetical protein